MRTSKIFMAVFIAMAMLSSCSTDNGLTDQPGKENTEATDAYVSFAVNIPHVSSRTISSRTTETGTEKENDVKSLHIFIYDAASPNTPTVARFTTNDGTLAPKDENTSLWVTSKPVSTKKTDKYIFAGVNLNTEIVNYITANGLGAFSYKEFAQEAAKLSDQANGFVMFNTTYPDITSASSLYENETEANENHISIPVSRVTAKAAVFTSPDFIVNGGGNMTGLKFGWRNLNNKFYFIQDRRDGMIKDHNWDSYRKEDFSKGTDAIPVVTSSTSPASYSYTTENAFHYVSGTSNVDETTYLSISGVFRPDKVITTSETTPASAADFKIEENATPEGSTFYVVRTDDGIANYFTDSTVAEKYAALCAKNTPGMPSLSGSYDLTQNTYTNGVCYFHVFVNGKAASPQAPYNVYRNQYFKVTIRSIQAPGNPSDNFDEGKTIQPDSWISTDIEITPWEVIDEDHDL